MATKTRLTRTEVLERLAPTEGLVPQEFECGVSRIGFKVSDGTVVFRLDGKDFPITKDAFLKAARICGIPASYVEKFPEEDAKYVVSHLDYWFKHRNDHMRAFLRESDRTVIAFAKATVDYYSRLELFERAENVLSRGGKMPLVYEKVHNSVDGGLHYTIIAPEKKVTMPLEVEIKGKKRGDVLYGGVAVQDHLLGELPLVVAADVYRLVCSNGQISAEAVQKWSRRADTENIQEWFDEAVKECYTAVEGELAMVRQLANVKLADHGAEMINSVFASFKVNTKARTAIMDNVVNSQAETMYDVYNAITAAANDEELAASPLAVRGLQQVAGGVLQHTSFCPSCHRVIR